MAVSIAGRMRSIHYAWIMVVAMFLALLIASGIRASFGVYLKPFEAEFHTNRATIALVASLSLVINGLSQPIVGHVIDRRGIRFVLALCLAIAFLALLTISFVTELWQLYIVFGIVLSAAVGGPATTMSTVMTTRWFVKHRGLIMGLLSSGTSAGQLIVVPLAMQLNLTYGWRTSYMLVALGMAALSLPIGLLVRSDPSDMGKQPYGAGGVSAEAQARRVEDQRAGTPLAQAVRTHGFWMLALSFFVCGYTTAGMLATHLVAYTVERGIDSMAAAAALGLMGAVNVVGTIVSGIVTDRVGRKNPLATIYFVRGLALLFLIVVDDAVKLNAFAIIVGMSYIATVPPTSALTAQLFGRASVGVIFGAIFMVHQIGGALGSFITGAIFDSTGNYYLGFLLGAILCFAAAAMSFSIKEQPVRRPSPAVALQ